MNDRMIKLMVSLGLVVFLIVSCASPAASPEAATAIPTSTTPSEMKPTDASSPMTKSPTSDGFTPSADDIAIDADKNTLIIASGYGRILKNGAKDWTAVVSGEWLENGDRIQLTNDGNAMIWLKDGSLIRFSGLTDFRLIEADKNPVSGRVTIAGQLLNGLLTARVIPLPTADSNFQIYFFTNLFSVKYSETARTKFENEKNSDESAIYFLGALGEEEDTFWQIQGTSELYDVQKSGQNYYAVEYPSFSDSSSEIAIPVLEDENIEEEIQSMLPDIGRSINLLGSSLSASQDIESVLHVVAEGNLQDGNKQRVIGLSLYDNGTTTIPSRMKTVQPTKFEMSLPQLTFIPAENKSGGTKTNGMGRSLPTFGTFLHLSGGGSSAVIIQYICRPEYGFGCKYPAGCDKKTGDGCELATGCNLVTKKGCLKPTYYCAMGVAGKQICSPTFREYALRCDANKKGDCDKFYDPAKFEMFETENCCVCNPPNVNRLPNWKYFHTAYCSEPGARPAGSCSPSTCK